jgi:C4-type Zn-finger protein
MSANNSNWVCFDCRFAKRQAKTLRRIPKCPGCGKDCYYLGYKVEIPGKSDVRNWRTLRMECRRRELQQTDKEVIEHVRETHAIERDIVRLESQVKNPNRKKLIAKLKEKY